VRRYLAAMSIVCAAVSGALSRGDSVLLAPVSIAPYFVGFAGINTRLKPGSRHERVDRRVAAIVSTVFLLCLVTTFWARSASQTALTQARVLALSASGLALIALLASHLVRSVLRHRRRYTRHY
jgi:hypothetical protein